MRNDQLDGLLALKLVADKRNFTAAAVALEISPSAVSQVIKQLEHRLGVTLLSRTTRSTSLTEVGQRFLSTAGPALDQILASLEEVGTYAKKPSGLLRLNMPRAIYSFMAPLIVSFTREHPEVSVELFFEDEQTDVFEKGFDAGIRLSDILAKDVVALKLFGPVKFVVAGAPKYFHKAGRPKHPKDLLVHNCIRVRFGRSVLYDKWEFEQKGEEFQVHVKGSLILNDSMLAKAAAIDGAGLVYTTEDSIRDLVKSGDLEIVLAPFIASSTGFYLYYPKKSQVQPKLRAFVDHIKNQQR